VATVDVQPTTTNTVAGLSLELAVSIAEDLDLLCWEVLDLTAVLLVLGVSVESNTGNPILDILWELLNGPVGDGSTLTVSTANDDGIWALGNCKIVNFDLLLGICRLSKTDLPCCSPWCTP
jgi:hypothetical protein